MPVLSVLPSKDGDGVTVLTSLPSRDGNGVTILSVLPSKDGDGVTVLTSLPSRDGNGVTVLSFLPSRDGNGVTVLTSLPSRDGNRVIVLSSLPSLRASASHAPSQRVAKAPARARRQIKWLIRVPPPVVVRAKWSRFTKRRKNCRGFIFEACSRRCFRHAAEKGIVSCQKKVFPVERCGNSPTSSRPRTRFHSDINQFACCPKGQRGHFKTTRLLNKPAASDQQGRRACMGRGLHRA